MPLKMQVHTHCHLQTCTGVARLKNQRAFGMKSWIFVIRKVVKNIFFWLLSDLLLNWECLLFASRRQVFIHRERSRESFPFLRVFYRDPNDRMNDATQVSQLSSSDILEQILLLCFLLVIQRLHFLSLLACHGKLKQKLKSLIFV